MPKHRSLQRTENQACGNTCHQVSHPRDDDPQSRPHPLQKKTYLHHIRISICLCILHFFHFASEPNTSHSQVNFMMSSIHWLMASVLMVFSSTTSKIPVFTLATTTSAAMAVRVLQARVWAKPCAITCTDQCLLGSTSREKRQLVLHANTVGWVGCEIWKSHLTRVKMAHCVPTHFPPLQPLLVWREGGGEGGVGRHFFDNAKEKHRFKS